MGGGGDGRGGREVRWGRRAGPARVAQIAMPPPSERRRSAAAMATPRPVLILEGMRPHMCVAMVHVEAATTAIGIVGRWRSGVAPV